jgi:hypothetical protein
MPDSLDNLSRGVPSLRRAFLGFVTSTTLVSTAMVFLSSL